MRKELTQEQKNEAVSLFLIGVQHYTQIAAHLNVPYQLVNTYMTKWKKKNGLLKTRKKRTPKVDPNLFSIEDQGSKYIAVLTKALFEELEFLRKFYRANTENKAA